MDFSQRFQRRSGWAGVVDATKVCSHIQHTVDWMMLVFRKCKEFPTRHSGLPVGPVEVVGVISPLLIEGGASLSGVNECNRLFSSVISLYATPVRGRGKFLRPRSRLLHAVTSGLLPGKEFFHVGSGGRFAREGVQARGSQHQPRYALMLKYSLRHIVLLRLGAHNNGRNVASAMRGVALIALVEGDDQQPARLNTEPAISGPMFCCSQLSAWASVPSCALSSWLGTMKEYCGKAPLPRSDPNCVNGTRFAACEASF